MLALRLPHSLLPTSSRRKENSFDSRSQVSSDSGLEFNEDENLRRISTKKSPLTDDEIDDYLGFFEEIGLYFHRGLVDMELVDQILGDSIIDSWEDENIRKAIGAIRGAEDDGTYFLYFERLAKHLIEARKKTNWTRMNMKERERRGGGRKTLKRTSTRRK